MRYALRLLSGGIAALDHRLIAPNLSGSGETISITRSWRVGRGFVNCSATPSLRKLLASIHWPRSVPSKTARNHFSTTLAFSLHMLVERRGGGALLAFPPALRGEATSSHDLRGNS